MSTLEALQHHIEQAIPLTRALGLRLAAYDGDRLVLEAPLAPNHNHQNTAFGGSLYSVAVMAVWCRVHLWLEERSLAGNVVIQTGNLDYAEPVTGDFQAQASLPQGAALDKVEAMLRRHGRARMTLTSDIVEEGQVRARFEGRFVILRPSS